ncbi:uncharacterized protein LOC102806440, partial [Saccoglossus kowalevskii]|uniref:Uncharacterized protein LOC102806440 n=1 Tax=Saccoglossus kowalevskii TaxID=10224 RepID=A0ABM0M9H6_SACKO
LYSEIINVSTLGAKSTGLRSMKIAEITVITSSGSTVDIRALIVPQITTPLKNYLKSSASLANLPYLQGLKLAHAISGDREFEVSVLVGADFYYSFVGDHVVRGQGPTAVSSKLGYLLSGPLPPQHSNPLPTSTVMHVATHVSGEDSLLQNFWNVESIGVRDDPTPQEITYDGYTKSHLRLEKNHYVAKLPWSQDHAPLSTNKNICEKRTRAMVQRLTPELRHVYDKLIKDQLNRGFIEIIPNDDKNSETGPPLLNDLASIILRFRAHKFGTTADIEKAFLHVGLDENDRKFTKFMWISDPDDPNSTFQIYRFKVVLFGAACSPFILNAAIKSHLENDGSEIATDLSKNIYVDNILSGRDTEQDLIAYHTEATNLMKSSGFNLREWATNSRELRKIAIKSNSSCLDSKVNVLGLRWDTNTDSLCYPKREFVQPSKTDLLITKREVVRATASLYDPLSFIAPVHISAKIFIQKLWKAKLEWDEPLTSELHGEWVKLCQELQTVTHTQIPRRYFNSTMSGGTFELHVFTDASVKAYGAVVYLRNTISRESALTISKSRVTPVKPLTIPRTELMGTLLDARLINVWKPFRKPIPAPLQACRLHNAPPVTATGVDFTGAVFVSVEKTERKAYICLLTCAVTRAIHLELVMDLSTDTFLRAFRRFAARRSLPSKIVSDNGSTYLSAAKEIQKLLESASIQNYFANHRMEWSFIPKRAPWFGGLWERLIGMTKTSLKKVLGHAFVSVDELQTVLTEIEATLNDRPLTYLSCD